LKISSTENLKKLAFKEEYKELLEKDKRKL
jgi:hypothetical protein